MKLPELIVFLDCCTFVNPFLNTWDSPPTSLHHHHHPTLSSSHTHIYTFHIDLQPLSTCPTPPHYSRLNSVNYLTLKPFQFLPYMGLFFSGHKVNLPRPMLFLLVFIYVSLAKQSLNRLYFLHLEIPPKPIDSCKSTSTHLIKDK